METRRCIIHILSFLLFSSTSVILASNLIFEPNAVLLNELTFLQNTLQPCGVWSSCSIDYASNVTLDFQTLLAAAVYPLDTQPLKSYVVLFDNVIDTNQALLSQIPILSNPREPQIATFLPTLLFITFGYGYFESKLVQAFEKWVLTSFTQNGIVFYSSDARYWFYGPSITYDLLPTLLALTLSYKSEKTDGILNGTTYKNLLQADFWQQYIQWLENTPSLSPYRLRAWPRGLAILAAIPYNELKEICTTIVKPELDKIYAYYLQGTLITSDDPSYLASIAIAAKWCNDRYHLFDENEVGKALQWTYLSLLYLDGSIFTYNPLVVDVYLLLNGLNSTIQLILDPNSNVTSFMQYQKEKLLELINAPSSVESTLLNNTVTITRTIILTDHLTTTSNYTSTLFFNQETSKEVNTVYEVPAPVLLSLIYVRSRKKLSKSVRKVRYHKL